MGMGAVEVTLHVDPPAIRAGHDHLVDVGNHLRQQIRLVDEALASVVVGVDDSDVGLRPVVAFPQIESWPLRCEQRWGVMPRPSLRNRSKLLAIWLCAMVGGVIIMAIPPRSSQRS
jgi:hypothetical protein